MISVVIPTLNEEQYIARCLESILANNPDEVIVVDGGSTDRTIEIARRYTDKIYVVNRRGIWLARQVGTSKSSGDIIVSCDADAVYPPGWLDKLTAPLKNPEVVAAGGPAAPIEDKPIPRFYCGLATLFAKHLHWFSGFNTAFRRDAWLRIGGYPRMNRGEDFALAAAMSGIGKTVYVEDAVAYIDVPVNRQLEMLAFLASTGMLISGLGLKSSAMTGVGLGFYVAELCTVVEEPSPIHHSQVAAAGEFALLPLRDTIPSGVWSGLVGGLTGVWLHHLVTEDVLNADALTVSLAGFIGLTLAEIGLSLPPST